MRWAALVIALLGVGCASECSSVTCADGCCASGACYLGTAVKGGATCPGTTATGGGWASGGGGGSSTVVDAGPAPCLAEHASCVVGGEPCCALSSTRYYLACASGTCAMCVEPYKKCITGYPCCSGTCDSSGYCPGSCGTYGDPCNATNPCCADFSSDMGRVCVAERCAFCKNPNAECTATKDCCAGLVCALKPGFTSIKTCQ